MRTKRNIKFMKMLWKLLMAYKVHHCFMHRFMPQRSMLMVGGNIRVFSSRPR